VSSYVFDQAWQDEKRRLNALARLYDEGTIAHLESLGVAEGWRCWEAGAGSGTIARWLAERVGGGGSVLATDLDTRFVEDIPAVDVRAHDLTSGPPEQGAFDLVHARAVVEHIPQHDVAFANLVAGAKPGGSVLVEDVVFPPPLSDPDLPLLTKTFDAFVAGFRVAGADPYFGLKLPRMFERHGLVDVGAVLRGPIVRLGTPDVEFLTLSLEHLRERFVAAGLMTDDEIDEVLAATRESGGTTLPPLIVAAWGRKRAKSTGSG
jgi:SAM-dependent methyltransferase